MSADPRHFLDISSFDAAHIRRLLEDAKALKSARVKGKPAAEKPLAGKNIADPRAAILSAAMMLDFLGEDAAAERVRRAVESTGELDGGTDEIGNAIVAQLANG